ncbi:MAG: Beta-lactamase class C-like and penicillin binding proteins (PBPs) superfamily [uncultured Chloroflexi bacterium]|uniref:Beta-lactamase class C-like and penicillin binding proteins (PBPs) superfamily n=1 Tax=uncultured Chloroflexota bacterium TaxID=166587 RepID=A0A6J4JA77_9CHLR|nr:MAG: Beta-lactamase class C-like and penicillin binding proteins (PBPs) superfamily [uncultured Chloroflexota bacterium]
MTLLDRTFDLLQRSVDEGLVPGAVAAVGTGAGRLRAGCYGVAQQEPQSRPLKEDMLFDVASLTKVVVTTSLALLAIERGDLFLDQRLADVLPVFGGAGKDAVTVRQVMGHTAGLPPWRELTPGATKRASMLQALWDAPLDRPPGTAVVYSDVGFMALAEALVEIGGQSLDTLATRDLFEPLGMRDSLFSPGKRLQARCVSTEVVAERGGAVTGEVHDERAAQLGGVSGHAGLFSTLADLEKFARMWLGKGAADGTRVLSPASVAAAVRDQTRGIDPGARRGLGWVLQPNGFWPAADLVSPSGYSHTGFTGTSLVIDPERNLYAILLTNRVHPTRGGGSAERIRRLRARFHNAAWAELS